MDGILLTFVPYLALVAPGWGIALARRGPWWAVAPLSVVAAAFLVRVFIVFHDCCHGSFFRSRPGQPGHRLRGRPPGADPVREMAALARRAPRERRGDLNRRGTGDVWTLTVAEYLAAPRWKRLYYHVFRNPFIMLGVGPALLFLLFNRWPSPGDSPRQQFSVHFTNAAIAVTLVAAHLTVGLGVFLLVQVPTLILAATAGVWLFYVQHQFEDASWARRPDWEPLKAALEGSSYYKLPRVLQWFTGSIGLHHIHHVQPRIPTLQQCLQDAVPALQAVPPLTLRRSLDTLRLRLVNETERRMVTWGQVKASLAERARAEARS